MQINRKEIIQDIIDDLHKEFKTPHTHDWEYIKSSSFRVCHICRRMDTMIDAKWVTIYSFTSIQFEVNWRINYYNTFFTYEEKFIHATIV